MRMRNVRGMALRSIFAGAVALMALPALSATLAQLYSTMMTAKANRDAAEATYQTRLSNHNSAVSSVSTLTGELATRRQAASSAETAYSNAVKNQQTARAEVTTATTGVTNATRTVATATTTRQTAQTALNTANTNLTNATAARTTANSTLATRQTARNSAKAAADSAAAALAANPTNKTLIAANSTAQSNLRAADQALAQATSAVNTANANYNAAVSAQSKATQTLATATNNLNSANVALQTANANLATKQAALTSANTALTTATSARTSANTSLASTQTALASAQRTVTSTRQLMTTAFATYGQLEAIYAKAKAQYENTLDTTTPSRFVYTNLPTTIVAGVPFSLTIQALNSKGRVATGFSGAITLSTTDARATGTGSVNITSGTATVTMTLFTAGSVTVTAANATLSVQGSVVVTPGPYSLTRSILSAPATMEVGETVTVTLTTYDAYDNPNPTGLPAIGGIQFFQVSSGGLGTFGATTAQGNGVYTASFTATQAGVDLMRVSISGSNVTSSASITIIDNAVLDHFVFTPVAPAVSYTTQAAGMPFSVTVTAYTSDNKIVKNFTGAVSFSVSGTPAAGAGSTAPTAANCTFTAGDQGSKSCPFTLFRSGSWTITASAQGSTGTSDAISVALPTMAIASPTALSTINASNVSAFPFSGSCSGNNGSVSLTATRNAQTATATASCNTASNPNYSGSINLSSLGDGSVSFTATHQDAWGNTSSQQSVSVGKDATAPTVTFVTSTNADGTYGVGDAITIVVNFSESITVTGTPTLQLATAGTVNQIVNCSTLSSTSISCLYTVAAGDTSADLNYLATNSLSLAAATITDSYSNALNATLPALNSADSLGQRKNIVIKTTGASVVAISAIRGYYSAGQTVDITITFSDPVVVTGTPGSTTNNPRLALTFDPTVATPAHDASAYYWSGSNSTQLIFRYTVAPGDTSLITKGLDIQSVNALTLNGGTIKDTSNSAASLLLPVSPGASGSLSFGTPKIVIDTTAPTIAITSPTGTLTVQAPSTNFSASFTVMGSCSDSVGGSGVETQTVYLRLNGSIVSSTTCTSGAFSGTIDTTILKAGAHTLTATVIDLAGNSGTSASATLNRFMRINLSREFYTYREDGTAVGTGVTLTSDVAPLANTTLTYTTRAVTANLIGTNFTAQTGASFTWPADSTSVILSGTSNFSIVSNATLHGDVYFTITLPTPSAATFAVLGTGVTTAEVNVLDSAVAGNYLFGHSLYTVNENSGTNTITVQRSGNLTKYTYVSVQFMDGDKVSISKAINAALANIDISNGTATNGTDYTGSNTILYFAPGEVEKTFSFNVPGYLSQSRAFWVKLNTPYDCGADATYTTCSRDTPGVRAQSIAKVRILRDESKNFNGGSPIALSTCSNNSAVACACNPSGSYSGYGGGAGTAAFPYLICSTAHLASIPATTGLFFKQTADLDISSFAGIASLLSSYDGAERTLTNGTSTFIGSALSPTSGASVTYVRSLNVIYSRVITASTTPSGVIGNSLSTTTPARVTPEIHNVLFSGAVHNTGTSQQTGLVVSNFTAATLNQQGGELNNILTMGLLYSPTAATSFGAIVGNAKFSVANADAGMSKLLNGASVVAGNSTGVNYVGTVGQLDMDIGYRIDGADNRGLITNQVAITNDVRMGGVVGYVNHATAGTGAIVNSTNYGTLDMNSSSQTNGYVGGIAGQVNINIAGSHIMDNVENHGPVRARQNVGGIVGQIYTRPINGINMTLTNTKNYGTITQYVGPGAGGIIGSAYVYSPTGTFTINGAVNADGSSVAGCNADGTNCGCRNEGAVIHAVNSGVSAHGGIIGMVFNNAGWSNIAFVLRACSNSGNITTNSDYAGGIIGWMNYGATLGGHTLTVSRLTSTGTITGGGQSTGGIFGHYSVLAGVSGSNNIVSFDALKNQGGVTGSGSNVGGVFGNLNLPGTFTTSTSMQNMTNSGQVAGTGTPAGGILGRVLNGSPATFTNISNSGAVSGSTPGGLIGITAGTNTVSIAGTNSNSGAITGTGDTGGALGSGTGSGSFSIDGFTNSGAVSTSGATSNAGGVIGRITLGAASLSLTVSNSKNSGTVTGGGSAGGMVGLITPGATATVRFRTISNLSTGTISSSGHSGGLLGTTTTAATGTLNFSNITNHASVTGVQTAGGFIGYQNSSPTFFMDDGTNLGDTGNNPDGGAKACLNDGAIAANSSNGAGNPILGAGGLIGMWFASGVPSGSTATIRECVNSGAVTAGALANPLYGVVAGTTRIGGIGGIIGGYLTHIPTGTTTYALTLMKPRNNGAISGVIVNATSGSYTVLPRAGVGGIIGAVPQHSGAPTGTTSVTLTGAQSSSSGSVCAGVLSGGTCTPYGGNAGGLIGLYSTQVLMNLTVQSSNGLSGASAAACASPGTRTCTIDSIAASPVVANSFAGGAFGQYSHASQNVNSITDTVATGAVTTANCNNTLATLTQRCTASSNAGGFFGGYSLSATVTGISSTLQRLLATGAVSCSNASSTDCSRVGGFAGSFQILSSPATNTMARLGATGNVTGGRAAGSAAASAFLGGLFGYYQGVNAATRTLTDVFAQGNVTTASANDQYIGGLIGSINTGTVAVVRSYYSGTLSGGDQTTWGGLIGKTNNNGTANFNSTFSGSSNSDSYFAFVSGGQNGGTVNGGQTYNPIPTSITANRSGIAPGRSVSDLKSQSFFTTQGANTTQWDFTNTWIMDTAAGSGAGSIGSNSGYPIFR